MQRSLQLVLSVLLAAPIWALDGADEQLQAEQKLAQQLQASIQCEPPSIEGDEPNCFLRYRGLEVELADMRLESSFPNIHLWSIGDHQSVLPRGARCIELRLERSAIGLSSPGHRPSILIHGSGVLGAGSDDLFQAKCSEDTMR
jgi:hypothetical protein